MSATSAPLRFFDTEQLSRGVLFTDVSAVQRDRGHFQATLDHRMLEDWSLQYVSFERGASICAGSAAPDRHSFVVPIRIGAGCRLLGQELTPGGIAVYAPGGEHADVSSAGLFECVLTAPPDLLDQAERLGLEVALPRAGSTVLSAPIVELSELQRFLERIAAASPGEEGGAEAAGAVTGMLETMLLHLVMRRPVTRRSGRRRISREAILRRLDDLLEDPEQEALRPSDLVRAAGISYPTLHRVFLEWFGMGPTRYLLLKRLYLARRRLLSGGFASVSDVATSCGFWEFGRFSGRYKALFGEAPSRTLARGKGRTASGSASKAVPATGAGSARRARHDAGGAMPRDAASARPDAATGSLAAPRTGR